MAGVVGVRKVGLRIGDVDIVSMVSFTDGGVEEFIHARKQRKASCLQRRNLQQRVEEEAVLRIVGDDALVSTCLSKRGYTYVNLDGCWGELNSDEDGNLVARNTTFPSGIKALADYVHGKWLKLGIYSSAGNNNSGEEGRFYDTSLNIISTRSLHGAETNMKALLWQFHWPTISWKFYCVA
ncbi:hypothetical protein QYF36_021769 [Acer negundo]|nr:hypothetical protein QYF36_021769 [Acer negundo]